MSTEAGTVQPDLAPQQECDVPGAQIYDLDGLPRTSIPRRRGALVGIGVLETLSLVVLLADPGKR